MCKLVNALGGVDKLVNVLGGFGKQVNAGQYLGWGVGQPMPCVRCVRWVGWLMSWVG